MAEALGSGCGGSQAYAQQDKGMNKEWGRGSILGDGWAIASRS